jgi:hypothetical protein
MYKYSNKTDYNTYQGISLSTTYIQSRKPRWVGHVAHMREIVWKGVNSSGSGY